MVTTKQADLLRYYWTLCLALILAFALAACAKEDSLGVFVNSVFAGFTYVGTDDHADISPVNRPKTFALGTKYIFLLLQSPAPIGGWKNLQSRLQEGGAQITWVPSSGGDLANITVGGPLFKLEFRYQGRHATISTEMEPRVSSNDVLSREWVMERYVLQFQD